MHLQQKSSRRNTGNDIRKITDLVFLVSHKVSGHDRQSLHLKRNYLQAIVPII